MPTNENSRHDHESRGQRTAPGRAPAGEASAGTESAPGHATSKGHEAFSIPSISLPKGGGAIRGIGEKFSVNPTTGTSSLSVPIATSPGRSGFGPQFSLSYDSGAGNGTFGFGWSMGAPSVTRKTDKGLPRYNDLGESDVFILSGAEDLVPILDEHGERIGMSRIVHGVEYQITIYRPRIEGLFARIERWRAVSSGITHWRSITRENVTTLYGYDADSRIADPDDPRRIFSYLISRTFDDKGNVALYEYVAEDDVGVDRTRANEANRSSAARATQRYLKRVRYGNASPWFADWGSSGSEPALPDNWHFETVFDYGDHTAEAPTPTPDTHWPVRVDPFSSYRAGFEVRTYRRCRRVLQFHHFHSEANVGNDCLVRSTDLHYSDELNPSDPANPIYTFLASVTQTGYRRDGPTSYIQRSMPPVEFDYTTPRIQPRIFTLDARDFENLPEGIDGSRFQWVDLDGEGLSGILTDQGGSWAYHRNLSPLNQVTLTDGSQVARARFGPMESLPSIPSRSELDGHAHLMDLAGDGHLDLVLLDDAMPGFFERTSDADWTRFQQFASLPHIDWADPNLRFIDLTGDGLADALITEDGVFTLYPSLGEAGFGAPDRIPSGWNEERGPAVVFADGTQTISLADMSGDGLTDLVRVRNGEICYWPNLGYGRFGAKVVMDNAPRFTSDELYDPKRIRLVDIDGSGSTDILYIGEDGVHVTFNRSGNAWAATQRIAVFPTADLLSSVQVFDLLGNGTACLVWSSPLPAHGNRPLLYMDLMGGVKPHLMIRSRNNLGAETRVRYAPSTKFYLEDKMAGRPWITKLPHLVHVVERVEVFDFIGRSRFVTRYAYHHGYFDGYEREFRGFGMVEQWDTEEHRDDTDFPEAEATNWDAISWTPPMHTKSWFHTGAFVEAGIVSRQYADEYWAEPATRGDDPARVAERNALLLPDTVMPDGLDPFELREAYRALKGSALRIEVYADDGTDRAEHPYTVTEQNFMVERVQGFGPNMHAVFLVHPRETLHYHYERQPADPRVTHDVTLAVDDFGNPLHTMTVAYGRRPGYDDPEPLLSLAFRDMLAHDQTRPHIAGGASAFTNPVNRPWDASPIDVYRSPLPCEAISAELTGITLSAVRFTFDELAGYWDLLWSGSYDIPYEQVSTPDIEGVGTPTGLARRIVGFSRTLYRKDDMGGLLGLGELESHALPGEAYQLALTPGLVDRIFGSRVDETTLEEGGYVRLWGGSDWWIPSGRVYFSPGDWDSESVELDEARHHFYLPRRSVDPLGSISRVTYDTYDLLVSSAADALDNTISADNDYRILHPYRSTDPNGNFSEDAFDCLGMVVGTAVYGKAGEGDSLAGFETDLSDERILNIRHDPLHDPATLLGSATSRIVVDLFAYYRTRADHEPQAPLVYSLTRETHVSDMTSGETRYQHALVYSDGLGHEIQHKIPAEPGPLTSDDDTVVSPRWVGSGWTILNNKGNVVRAYEPFFTATHEFEFDRRVGVSSIMFYDSAERVIVTLHPDNTFEKTVFNAWRQETWDQNDTALIRDPREDADVGPHFTRLLGTAPHAFTSWHDLRIGGTYGSTPDERAANRNAAQKVADHAETPAVAHFDSLGRTCLGVVDNGPVDGMPQRYATRTALDTESKPLAVFDADGRRVVESCLREYAGSGFVYVAGYDLTGHPLYMNGMDGGERRIFNNILGNRIRSWNARGFIFRSEYDALHRITHLYVDNGGHGETLSERVVYGERHPDASLNLKGRMFRHYDGGGVASFDRYDFKGNLLESGRQLSLHTPSAISPPDVDRAPDWSPIETITESPSLDISALDASAAPLLDADDAFRAISVLDALNRPIQTVTPHVAGGKPSVAQPIYNEAGLLEMVDIWLQQPSVPSGLLTPSTADIRAVTGISYNARGQRMEVALGNGSVMIYTYDPETFRTSTLTTTRPAPHSDECTVQALSYTYDPVGNITRLRDDADIQNVVYFRNQRVEPSTDYTYDPLYRLIRATGREHLGQTLGSLSPASQPDNDDGFRMRIPSPGDGYAMGTYTELYTYDPVGNLLRMAHQVASGGWNRYYTYDETSRITPTETGNRLSTTSLSSDPTGGPYSAQYRYDDHGNMVRMPHLPEMTWDVYDHLQSTTRQSVGSGVPETTYYTYDSGGQRLRKITYRAASSGGTPTRKAQRIYLGGFEIYREYDSTGTTIELERETLHVMVGDHRALIVETRTVGTDPAPGRMIRYQFSNHLGSASLELDENAAVISYEEYFPYGSTSYQAVRSDMETPKRYRYTGKERDEESDLYYHGARYYAPWLGRWTACDPAGIDDGPNLYVYARNNPITFNDPDGRQHKPGDSSGAVGEPGLAESLIPVWGEGRSAVNSFQKGEWGWGLFHTAMAISDVFLVKSLVTAGGKLIVKTAIKEAAEQEVRHVAEQKVVQGAEKKIVQQTEKKVAAESEKKGIRQAEKQTAQNTKNANTVRRMKAAGETARKNAGKTGEATAKRNLAKAGTKEAAKKSISTKVKKEIAKKVFEESAKRGKIVLGHYDGYIKMAKKIGAEHFGVPTTYWESLSNAERWALNREFLDKAIARGDEIILSTPFSKARPGSYFRKELEYLMTKGYTRSSNGTRMILRGK